MKARPQQRYVPTMKLQWRIWQLVTSRGFEYCLFTLIIINTVALAMKVCSFYTSSTVGLESSRPNSDNDERPK